MEVGLSRLMISLDLLLAGRGRGETRLSPCSSSFCRGDQQQPMGSVCGRSSSLLLRDCRRSACSPVASGSLIASGFWHSFPGASRGGPFSLNDAALGFLEGRRTRLGIYVAPLLMPVRFHRGAKRTFLDSALTRAARSIALVTFSQRLMHRCHLRALQNVGTLGRSAFEGRRLACVALSSWAAFLGSGRGAG